MSTTCTWCGHHHDPVAGTCPHTITIAGGERVPCPCRRHAILDAFRARRREEATGC